MNKVMKRQLRRGALGIAVAVGTIALAGMGPAHATVVTFSPSAAGLAAGITPFGSATQNGFDTALAVIQPNGTFTENGILRFDVFNDASSNSIPSNVSGLKNTSAPTYGMFLTFTATGTLVGWNPATPQAAVNGTFSTISYSLLGNPGNTQTITAATTTTPPSLSPGTDITLATGGTVLSSSVQISNIGVPGAGVNLALTQAGTGFFAAPPNVNEFDASFINTNSPSVFQFAPQAGNVVNLAILAGGFQSDFNAAGVPEPASMAIIGTGLVVLGMVGRRRRAR